MRWPLITALLLVATSPARAELLDGAVDLCQSLDGKPVARLEDQLQVDVGGLRGDWVTVGFFATFEDERAFDGCCTIVAGQPLIGDAGQKLGTTTAAVMSEGWFKDPSSGKLKAYVSGFVPQKKVRLDSSVEHAMARILNEKKGPILFADLEGHLKEFPYEPFADKGDMTSFYMSNLPYPSGGRFFLFFYKKQLVALIYQRPLLLKIRRPTKSTRWGYWMYVEPLAPKIRKQMEDYYFPILAKAG